MDAVNRRSFVVGAAAACAAVAGAGVVGARDAGADEAENRNVAVNEQRPPIPMHANNASDISKCASGFCDYSDMTLEERVQRLEDINAIRNLKFAYWDCLDSRDLDRMMTLFTEDARLDIPSMGVEKQGREDVVNSAAGLPDCVMSCHQGHQHFIEITGDGTAHGTADLRDDLFNAYTGAEFRGRGYYDEEYVKIDGCWYIDHMTLRYNMSSGQGSSLQDGCANTLNSIYVGL